MENPPWDADRVEEGGLSNEEKRATVIRISTSMTNVRTLTSAKRAIIVCTPLRHSDFSTTDTVETF